MFMTNVRIAQEVNVLPIKSRLWNLCLLTRFTERWLKQLTYDSLTILLVIRSCHMP